MKDIPQKNFLALRIGGLELQIDARDSHLELAVPSSHQPFLVSSPYPNDKMGHNQKGILFDVRNGQHKPIQDCGRLIIQSEVWQLWQDDQDNYVFLSPKRLPPRQIIIDPNFTTGEVIVDSSTIIQGGFYPLISIDIRIIVNWLARSADLILHAAGLAIQGRGYCFIGPSGAGKSTLTSALIDLPGVTALGEDQVILRYLDGQFWIFGTPWHERPSRCSPVGVPLEKIFFLNRHGSHQVTALMALDGITRILQTAFVPFYLPDKIPAILEQLTLLGQEIPFYELNYKIDSQILPIITNI